MPRLKTFIKLVNAPDVSADELIGLEIRSGRDYYAQKLSVQMQSLTQEEAAAGFSEKRFGIHSIRRTEKSVHCREHRVHSNGAVRRKQAVSPRENALL